MKQLISKLNRLKSCFSDMSFIQKLTSAYVLAILIPTLCIGIFTLHRSNAYVNEQVRQGAEMTMEQVELNIRSKLQLARNIAENIASSRVLKEFLIQEFTKDYESYRVYSQNIQPTVSDPIYLNKISISRLRVFFYNNSIPEGWSVFLNHSRLAQMPWYEKLEKRDVRFPVWYYDRKTGDFTCISPILDFITTQWLGVVAVDMHSSDTFAALLDLKAGEQWKAEYYVMSPKENLFIRTGHPKDTLKEEEKSVLLKTSKNILNIGGNLFCIKRINELDMEVVGKFSLMEIQRKALWNNALLIMVVVLGVFILEIITLFLLRFILSRFYGIVKVLDRVAEGHLDERIPVDSKDEIGRIAMDFNILIERIHQLIKDVVAAEGARKDAQITALQMQINPHFTLNTLEMFRARMERTGQHEIADAITDLGRMLNYNMRISCFFVKLEDELQYIHKYVKLWKIRYGERIRLVSEIPRELERFMILKFILQPIVENSIKHGMKGLEGNMVIKVGAIMQGNQMILFIEDNGVGLDSEKLERINAKLASPGSMTNESEESASIGICNICRRLYLFYGETAAIRMESEAGAYAKTYLILPGKEDDKKGGDSHIPSINC